MTPSLRPLACQRQLHRTGVLACIAVASTANFHAHKHSILPGMQEAWAGFQELGQEGLRSALLRGLTLGAAATGMAEPLRALQGVTDWDAAAEAGRIVPHAGVDAAYDAALAQASSLSCCALAAAVTQQHAPLLLFFSAWERCNALTGLQVGLVQATSSPGCK